MDPALTPMHQPRPFSGFYLRTACALDAACPGYLNRVLHAPTLKRSVQFAAYAEINFAQPDLLATRLRSLAPAVCEPSLDPVAQIARALIQLPPRSVLQALYGSVPDGLVGLMSRLGSEPLPNRADYRLAHCLLADRAHRARAKLLRHTEGQLRPSTIKVVSRLDSALLHRAVLGRAGDLERVEALNAAVALIRALVPEATNVALRRSLDGVSPSDRSLSRWILGWLARLQRLPVSPPIAAGDPELRLLQGCDMAELGRRLQNCAADQIGHIALGSRVFYEWIGPGAPAVVELRCLSGGRFVLEDLKAARNEEPEAAVADAIRARLMAAGVLSYSGSGRGNAGGALAGLLGLWDFGEQGEPAAFLASLLTRDDAVQEAA